MHNPTSSDARNAPAKQRWSMARSRIPNQSDGTGASNIACISCWVKRFTKRLSVRFIGSAKTRRTCSRPEGTRDLNMQPYASVVVHGKGRRQRCLPLWKETASALKAWLAVRGTVATPEVFTNARGEAMTRSGFQYILRKHTEAASTGCPSILSKRVSLRMC